MQHEQAAGRPRPPGRTRRAPPTPAPNVPTPARPPRLGSWLWTCRAGFETHLYEELGRAHAVPELLGGGLVSSAKRPRMDPAFARTGFLVRARAEGPLEAVLKALADL